jgi:alpha-tubulin suppressor-like RCC1 family protein
VGDSHTCARRTTGRLFCWGLDNHGQLGDGPLSENRSTPSQVAGARTDWTTVSAGWAFTCGRRQGGRLSCWGTDAYGQLGRPDTNTDRYTPREVVGARTDWTGPVAAGFAHTCARRTNGSEYCWGSDGAGQLGNGFPAGDSEVPVEPVGPGERAEAVTSGQYHSCLRTASRRLYCWGSNDESQLGSATAGGPSGVPAQVLGNRTDWAQISAGSYHTCALTTGRRAFCWGSNETGQLGDNTTSGRAIPAQVGSQGLPF